MEIIKTLRKSNLKDLIFLIQLGFTIGYYFTILNGYPIWFKQPLILCKNKVTNLTFLCEENYVCNSSNITFTIEKSSFKSMANEFFLLCERKSEQRKSISIILGGSFFGTIFNSFVFFPSNKKIHYIAICILLSAITTIISTFINNLLIISVLLSCSSFLYTGVMANLNPLAIDVLSENNSKLAPPFLTFFLGFSGCIYILFSYFIIHGNWRILLLVWGIFGLILSFSYTFIKISKNSEKEFKKEVNL